MRTYRYTLNFSLKKDELGTEGLSIRLGVPQDGAALETAGTEPVDATLTIELDAGLTAGFRGFYSCGA